VFEVDISGASLIIKPYPMSAIFNFSSLVTALLLSICTTTYLRELRPTIFDGSVIDAAAAAAAAAAAPHQVRPVLPLLASSYFVPVEKMLTVSQSRFSSRCSSLQDMTTNRHKKREGLLGFLWKLSRIGERVSPYVGAACALQAINILFFK
jgi:Protein of unknown function (DUF1242)